MHPIRSIDLDRLPEVRAALTSWLARARERFRLSETYVYGSFARGRPHEGSDIDLVLIGPFRGKMPYRIAEVLGTTDLPVQPLCFTPEEWKTMAAEGNPLAAEVLRSGVRV
jgi:predicted nucleotidyltransferase